MYGLHIPPSWEFEPRDPLIFLVCFKVDMLFIIWTKFQENLAFGFVLINLTQTSLTFEHSKFYQSNFGVFEQSIFRLVVARAD